MTTATVNPTTASLLTIGEFLQTAYRTGYQDPRLIVAPVAIPVGIYALDASKEQTAGAIFVGSARLTLVDDVEATGDDVLRVTKSDTYGFAPYSESQLYISTITEGTDALVEADDTTLINVSAGCAYRD